MKFMVMFRENPKIIQYAESHMREKYGNGASLIAWKQLSLVVKEKDGDVPIRNGIAYLCEGSFFSYLCHKIIIGRYATVTSGWIKQ